MIFSEWKISARLWTLALLMVFLQGCGASPALSQPLPDAIVTATLTPSSTPPPPADVPLPTITITPPPRIDRVMIVSIDGLRPDAIA